MMKILYIDGVGPFGGASRSLFEAVRKLKAHEGVLPHFLIAKGTASEYYNQVTVDTITTRGLTRFDNTEYSHYRGLRWLVLLRELAYFPYTLIAIARAHSRWKDIAAIHVNEITELIPGLIAKRVFKVPLIVHVRSAQSKRLGSLRSRWIYHALKKQVDGIIAIDETVRATLPIDLPVTVIHNSFAMQPNQRPDQGIIEKIERLPPAGLTIGFVGNLHVSKGILDLLEAANIVATSGRTVNYVIVGGHTRADKGFKGWLLRRAGLTQNLDTELSRRIHTYRLENRFHLLGPTADIQSVYARIDVLCFPSHFDAPGRPIFEAAFFGVPCVTCVSAPKSDTLVPGTTGLVARQSDPQDLAAAIVRFADDRPSVQRMGENSRELANTNFDPAKNATKLMQLYQAVISSARG
jgi:glycosyltransferase involved in cell wall biosynthesis